MTRLQTSLLKSFALLVLTLAALAPSVVTAADALALSSVARPVFETSLARVVSPRKADLSAEMDGIMLRIDTREAANVTAGDTLFAFDCRGNDLALQRAELALKISQKTASQEKAAFYRSTEGLRNNTTSVAQNEVVQLAFETASLDVTDKSLTRDAAALAVEHCIVKAPFTGVITAIAVGAGSYLTAGTRILSMTETENLEVVARLTPAEIDILGSSSKLEFISRDEDFPLTVRAIEPVFDPVTGAQRVLLRLPRHADLPIGLTGVLKWQGDRASLPSEYLVRRESQIGLLIDKNGAETFLPVPGAIEGLPVLVKLPADTKVIRP